MLCYLVNISHCIVSLSSSTCIALNEDGTIGRSAHNCNFIEEEIKLMFWLLQNITRFYFIHPFFKTSLCRQQGYFDFVVALGNVFRFTCWVNVSRLEAWHIWWWRRIQQPSERRGWGRASLPLHRSRSQPRHPGNPLVKGREGGKEERKCLAPVLRTPLYPKQSVPYAAYLVKAPAVQHGSQLVEVDFRVVQ